MKKICFIAQFPPPIHGLSKAIETLYNSKLKQKYSFEAINITNNKIFINNLFRIIFSRSSCFYFTISQTKFGNIRDLIILKILKLKHSKCIIHLHGGYYRTLIEKDCSKWQRILNYKAMENVDAAIVLGNTLKYIFKDLIREDKIYIVPNCVDKEYQLSRNESIEKLNILKQQSVIHIIYLSNFIESKGYKEVLYLAKLVSESNNSNFKFHFAGNFFSEADKTFFFNYIEENNLNNIEYHGIVKGRKKKELLKLCNIFILLTRYPNEGQPISILEAKGNSMFIVTTNHAGIPDIAKNNINGIVLDKDNINIDFLHKSLEEIVNNRDHFINICRNNYDEIVNSFSEEQYIENMDYIFNKISEDE